MLLTQTEGASPFPTVGVCDAGIIGYADKLIVFLYRIRFYPKGQSILQFRMKYYIMALFTMSTNIAEGIQC